jgi:glycerophosphoryl diester phosphodiesterase
MKPGYVLHGILFFSFFYGGFAYCDTVVAPMILQDFILIAHRGVVTETIPENSLASLEETIRRGYTHIEVDIRSTKDGHAMCLHDESLRRTTGLPHLITELTLAELRALAPVDTVPDFATFCARCEGRIGLMPDIKEWPPDVEEAFAKSIEQPMLKHGLMEDSYFIGKHSLTRHFSERGRLSWREPLETVRTSDRAKDSPGDRYFIFNHAADFDADSVKGFQDLGLKVIVSINIFHYLRIGHWKETGHRDVARMLEYGVDGLQIDSVYEPAFREHKSKQRN